MQLALHLRGDDLLGRIIERQYPYQHAVSDYVELRTGIAVFFHLLFAEPVVCLLP